MKTVLVTGAAGFIGAHLSRALMDQGYRVIGLDNHNDYYDPALKEARLSHVIAAQDHADRYTHHRLDLMDLEGLRSLFDQERPDYVMNLAAQAGVRYSLENPFAYVDTNVRGFLNLLEMCRHTEVKHLVYASTSSVYGANTAMPYHEEHGVKHPLSLYAATKLANEDMAHSYSHLYGLPTTGVRFFTVYGPWGRPDMAMFKFTKAILEGTPIDLYNYGRHGRDFTYVDDIVEGLVRMIPTPAQPDPTWDPAQPNPSTSQAPWRLYNIGANAKVELMDYVRAIEVSTGKTAKTNLLPMQATDVPDTYADVTKLVSEFDYTPQIMVQEGVDRFVTWYRDFYKI